MADIQQGNLWERSGWTLRVAMVALTLNLYQGCDQSGHPRPSPDIGTAEDESNSEGQVVGIPNKDG